MGFRIVYADITQLKADAIVNPTDRFYSGGGGVDELIHEICGKDLDRATAELPELHLGEAKATEGFALPCKYIIHTSGPKWRESHFLEISLLGSCYRNNPLKDPLVMGTTRMRPSPRRNRRVLPSMAPMRIRVAQMIDRP